MGASMNSRFATLAAGMTLGIIGVTANAHAYSTKVHLTTAYHVKLLLGKDCTIKLNDWNKGKLTAQKFLEAMTGGNRSDPAWKSNAGAVQVKLGREICGLITGNDTYPYFLAASTGPDTFPGVFGTTDETHALLWNTAWQIQVLWQNARTRAEKAFALGWLWHFAGDLNAHGLANLHAEGVWLSPKAKDKAKTIWGHLLTETYYAKRLTPYPKGFDNRLVWPDKFVKKMFYNPNSPIYQHTDFLWNRYLSGPHKDRIGMVAKVFTAIRRAMFLLWDFHAKEMHRWAGHKDFYKPRKNRSVGDWFHWLFADQAYNLHKKKFASIEKLIGRWQEATHRAQQAIVADDDARFNGKTKNRFGQKVDFRYPDTYERFGKTYTKKDVYASAGFKGLLDAYKYLANGIQDYINPFDFITITDENAPGLRTVLDVLKKVGQAGKAVLDGIRSALSFLKDLLLWPFRALGTALSKLLDPVKEKISEFFFEKAICGRPGMDVMCKSIDAQRAAFGVQPGKIATYLNWPIYRNTIVAGALMLRELEKAPRQGDETHSPGAGFPSGDFGCTLACTRVGQGNWRSFMPMAGSYYDSADIQKAFPDYCMVKAETRRNDPLNADFKGLTNDQANFDYTCFARAGAGTQCGDKEDAYSGLGPAKFEGHIGEFLGKLYEAIAGRWTFRDHTAPRSQAIIETLGLGKDKPDYLCYKALAYDQRTRAGPLPDPKKENQGRYQKTRYSLREMLGNLFKPLAELFELGFNSVAKWAETTLKKVAGTVTDTARRTCKDVEKWVDTVLSGAARTACELKCKATSPERKKVCVPLVGCNWVDVPFTLDRTKYNNCVNRDCRKKEKQIVKVCQ
jgi:hypothetical protein